MGIPGEITCFDPGMTKKLDQAVERLRLGDTHGALAKLDAAVEALPNHALLLALRASVHIALGNLEAAEQDCTEAIASDAMEPLGFANRGALWRLLGDLEAADRDFSRAVTLGTPRWCGSIDPVAGCYENSLRWSGGGRYNTRRSRCSPTRGC